MRQDATPRHASRHRRALLVVSDSGTRSILELILSVRGLVVTSCDSISTGRAALAEGTPFALVVMDSTLPDGAGADIAREIRSNPDGAQPAIVIVGEEASPDRATAVAAGADEFVARPIDAETLNERLDAVEHRLPAWPAGGLHGHADNSNWLAVIDDTGTISRASSRAEQLLGYTGDALTGTNVFSLIHPQDAPLLLSMLTQALVRQGESRAVEVRVRRDGDAWRRLPLSISNQVDDPAIVGISINLRGPRVSEPTVNQMTTGDMRDGVTGLPNRSLFIDRVAHAVARAERRQQPAVVMTVDFNGFMPVGEEYRRGVSESLVVMLAQRLRACLRASDTVARLGYDEFGLLLEEIDDLGNVRILAERIIRSMAVPFIDESERVELVPNIGIAISTPERSAADDLLSDANIARAWARIQGSGRYVQFDGSMQMPAAELAGRDGADDHAASSTPSSDLVGSVDARFAELHERLSRIEEHLATIANLAGPNASRSWHSPE